MADSYPQTTGPMLYDEIVQLSKRVAATSKRNEKVADIVATLCRVGPHESVDGVALK